jgi:DNA modification methylase
VLDPFFGSGTVGEVCSRLKRRFVGIEIKPEYAEIAAKRLQWERADSNWSRPNVSRPEAKRTNRFLQQSQAAICLDNTFLFP